MLSPATLNKGQEMLEQGTLKMPLTVDYWVSDDNLVRAIVIVMEAGGKKVVTTTGYWYWGRPVDIIAPPAAEVGPRPRSLR